MHLGRRKRTAQAVAAAVIGGLLGGGLTGTAQAAPVSPVTTPDVPRSPAEPAVWPRPQSLRAAGPAVPLGDEVTLLADADADPYAVAALREVLRAAGVRTVHTALPGGGTVLRVGSGAAQEALRALRVAERADLPAGGYRLATGRFQGRDTVALDGVGTDGLFHGVQTLRQLIEGRADGEDGGRRIPGVVVRDWPGTAVRGLTEGFYGRPWSHEQRLAQLDFMGRTKQNRYLYAPGDDPYRQTQWRDPYPAERRAEFRALAERARANHVTLAWAVAPAQSMCLASDADVKALTRKIDAMWALGVRSFQLQFQDVSYSEWRCSQDKDTFGRGPEAGATAHARVANAVARHLADRYPGAEPLTLMPTEYYQDGATAYRTALAAGLDGRVQVAWTGVGAVPPTITGRQLAGARDALRHPLVTMDNYPVNDYAQDRLFLGPAVGREPAVAAGSAAFLANAMEQAAVSRIPLFTAADYAWNPRGYRPQESWRAAVDDLAGPHPAAREALRALAGNDASSLLDPAGESAYLKPLMAAFWRSRTSPDTAVREKAARELRAAFTVMREAPQRLAGTAGGALDDEIGPWLDQLSRYGLAGETAVDMLLAQARGEGAAAWQSQLQLEPLREALKASRATVGAGVLDPFLTRAVTEAAAWTGADRQRDAGRSAALDVDVEPDAYTVRLDRSRPVDTVTVMTEPGSGDSARVEAYVAGEGWRALGAVSPTGWTQTELKGLRAEAVRIAWDGAGGQGAPRVRSLVPWFADEPPAELELARATTDAVIGGPAQRVDVRLVGRSTDEVRGALTARAPRGIQVRLPKEARIPRGTRATVPLQVSVAPDVPAGSYQVPVSFAGEERVLTVRAFPRTAGPDLARTATASSSGDETPDFPAVSALDGDPATRWSSQAEDGAWWQLELTNPARIGQVVLHWQDAYASRYRVQVSADGRVWRTAATVADGRGGRESVRMDAADTRFLRVQGDARATRYGYSLWSVETYAVAPPPPAEDAGQQDGADPATPADGPEQPERIGQP
ncbi:beta-N-acetylglucosaminidase domain-containing protein [Streptomyces sp. P9(2023)]|uniref:beta-N-acetylglucosaminidase domain-containing protein n=1 Tax=Streptomyces sp. P9(2023) TaxID=3064394 RepID=UPI0028F405DD|nr:beta-N-acetylglucosaminidase domain-containing protein [Streptomyces sp. P9(2023)]MDT9690312.1 beta-N-acetylglucosaminidase domain-containing protein [Streptomyces sp. P9(2023)]